jgi:uncharacterized protein YndB with AHSA1/START domain
MEPLVIRREIEIAAPAATVWRFVATEEGMRRWWPTTRHLVLEPRAGGRFELRVQFPERSYFMTGSVLSYDPPRRLAVTWREQDGDRGRWPAETVVTITLVEQGAHTRVTVEHSGFEALPEAYRDEARESYEHGWTQEEMEHLRTLAEQAAAEAPR